MYYYSATIDSATDNFSGKYQFLSTIPNVVPSTVGVFEAVLTSVGGFTTEEIDAAIIV